MGAMLYVDAITLGLIQGVTEFLPISSTGHVFLLETWMDLVPSEELSLWLHLGSLSAVIGYFWKDLWRLLIGFLQMLQEKRANNHGVYLLKIMVATFCTLPTAWLTYTYYPYGEMSLFSVGVTLLITAGLIVVSEKMTQAEQLLSWRVVIILGLVQGFSIVPGLSRAGLTIALLIWLGINRNLAATTSFLLSIPTILGAAFFVYLERGERFVDLGLFEIMAVVSSAVSAYLAIALMMRWIEGRWIYFAYYCAFLGVVVMLV